MLNNDNILKLIDESDKDIDTLNVLDINIWLETKGKKKNTFISGWDIPINSIKEHLKFLKKSIGCNGTLKTKSLNNETLIMLQGDNISTVYNYLIQLGIKSSNIHIKG